MSRERNLRLFVRSLLKESATSRVLGSGVTPELFAESFRKFWGLFNSSWMTMNAAYDENRIHRLVKAGLSEEEAQAVLELVRMCTDPTNPPPPYNFRTIVDPIFKALGYKDDPKSKEKVWKEIQLEFNLTHLTFSEYGVVILVSARTTSSDRFSVMSEQYLSRHLDVMRYLSADTLERRINFMDSMYAFLEPKDLDRRTRQKLMSMVREGVDGMMQAAEIYRMM